MISQQCLIYRYIISCVYYNIISPNKRLTVELYAMEYMQWNARNETREFLNGNTTNAPCCGVDQCYGYCLQADIYSLGVLLWEIVTAEIPERGRMRPVQVCLPVTSHKTNHQSLMQ